jgi:hypothetical protein
MISIDDCIAFCGLTREEVDAVSEHEHIPESAAAALASHLLNRSGGAEQIRRMLVDDIHLALEQGRVRHASELFGALRHFIDTHPEAKAGLREN